MKKAYHLDQDVDGRLQMLVSVLVYKKEKTSLTNKNKIQKSRNSIVYRSLLGYVSPKSKPTSQLNNEHPTLKTDDNLCM